MQPAHSREGGNKQSVAVIIPTFNEAESIGAVIAEMQRGVVDRVIVADGGSSDNTPQRACDAGAEVVAVGRGYGLACLTGVQAAADADIVVFMDGDGEFPTICGTGTEVACASPAAWPGISLSRGASSGF